MSKHVAGKEKKKLRILRKIKIDEISLVDRPMHQGAGVAILKRADAVQMEKRIALTTMTAGHTHSLITDMEGGERQIGITSFVEGHTHDWVMDKAGNILIAEVEGHSHAIGILIQKCVDDISDILPEEGPLADLLHKGVQTASVSETNKEVKMTDEEKKAAEIAKEDLDKAVSERDSMQKRAERSEAIAKLSSELKKYFDEQNDSGQDEFLGKTSEEQAEILKNAKAADPVVYTATDGRTFNKSADTNLVAEVKRGDAMEKELAEGKVIAKRADFEKRAAAELGHLSGDSMIKADLLEAVALLPQEKQEKALEILKSQDAGMAAAMTRIGASDAPDADKGAEAQMETLASKIAKDEKIDQPQAYERMLKTEEGMKLYGEMREGK